jgi:hypothetical protein
MHKLFYFHILFIVKFDQTFLWMLTTLATSQIWKENPVLGDSHFLKRTAGSSSHMGFEIF